MTTNRSKKHRQTIAIIGAGPAGLTSAKQALARGLQVIIYEKQTHLGGIWNKYGHGAYPSVRMQSSKLSFHFSDFPPSKNISDFPTRDEVYQYLCDYADYYQIESHIRYNTEVIQVKKVADKWQITTVNNTDQTKTTQTVDLVMVANGELWNARLPNGISSNTIYKTAKDYRTPTEFIGKKILVVGGGVSGADIAAELSTKTQVDWSIRTARLFLPRWIGQAYNDELFSYIGRIATQAMPYKDFLALLDKYIPDYMATYRQSGLLPQQTINNAIHINDRIIPAVTNKHITVRSAFAHIDNNKVTFNNGEQQIYDAIIFCTGYQLPNYNFIAGFDPTDLFEHFIYRKDPSLTVINTPVHTEAFGTACPYFEMIAQYALKISLGELPLPDNDSMENWCELHLKQKKARHYYDCWLETIRLGLITQQIPSPTENFSRYWQLVSQTVSPTNLNKVHTSSPKITSTPLDQGINVEQLKLRLIKSFTDTEQLHLVKSKQLSDKELKLAEELAEPAIQADLSYEKPEF